ncbi:hypothetical protein [Nostoc sphaeroides]|uniref:Uncharacterized protein n=1 Tax=Nostoc sphaeroides CCNUC1 TaxID=2653204 RepID=A0A5P8WBU5_9NOSO|nr:hypothetical protein [Nostoc sphaeroides]MCC5632295.1 hypothetical protein [Nostoc sphaeroides CHAB 2801]QFS50277.1 hypothetical protein GXM_07771 [Nostoc sphaeroides CCNUC1]
MDLEQQEAFFTPLGDVGGTTGYANISAMFDATKLAGTIDIYLNDSLLLSKLTRRVYELLQEDIRCQRERVNNYGCDR